jgi:hypothetical protein
MNPVTSNCVLVGGTNAAGAPETKAGACTGPAIVVAIPALTRTATSATAINSEIERRNADLGCRMSVILTFVASQVVVEAGESGPVT